MTSQPRCYRTPDRRTAGALVFCFLQPVQEACTLVDAFSSTRYALKLDPPPPPVMSTLRPQPLCERLPSAGALAFCYPTNRKIVRRHRGATVFLGPISRRRGGLHRRGGCRLKHLPRNLRSFGFSKSTKGEAKLGPKHAGGCSKVFQLVMAVGAARACARESASFESCV